MAKDKETQGIKKRAWCYVYENGFYNFMEWAICTTSLGEMAEPYFPDKFIPGENKYSSFDPSDPMVRVDELLNVSPQNREQFFLEDTDTAARVVTGGDLMPRDFLKAGSFE